MRTIGSTGEDMVAEGRNHIPFSGLSDETLQAENSRRRRRLRELRRRRYSAQAVGYGVGLAVGAAGLWCVNNLAEGVVGVLVTAVGGATLAATFETWGRPGATEQAVSEGVDTIDRIRRYRRTLSVLSQRRPH
ncbi:hypothetical protein ASF63_15745 [Microbacterium sp. Leaf320]|nr:hypothetical protein ASF63_15745 [Microbacterium sp. Leaf320]